jgi:hypothetical protein
MKSIQQFSPMMGAVILAGVTLAGVTAMTSTAAAQVLSNLQTSNSPLI